MRLKERLLQLANLLEKRMAQPNGWVAAFTYAVIGSSLVPLPVDSTIPGLVAIAPHRWRRLTLSLALGSIVGGVLTYLFGFMLGQLASTHLTTSVHTSGVMENAAQLLNSTGGMLYLATVSLLAGPYRLTMLAAGATQMSFLSFMAIIAAGRIMRFSLIAVAARRFGLRTPSKKHRLILAAVYAVVIGALSLLVSTFII